MTQNTIEIEVELKGQKDALKSLDQVKEGAEGIGETFKGVGDIVGKTNQQMGESLNAVSNAVGESAAAFTGMREAIGSVASGGAGITALLGPLALLTTAVGAAYEAYRQLSGAAREAEDRQEALAAAASDLQSKLEALAEKGLIPAKKELLDFSRANLKAQLQKELLEKQVERAGKVILAEVDAQKALNEAGERARKIYADEATSSNERVRASERVKEAYQGVIKAQQQSAKVFDILSGSMTKQQAALDAVEKRYKSLEDQTEESLKTKAKELIARRAAVDALRAEVQAQDEAAKLTALREVERTKQTQLDAVEKLNRTQLKALVDGQTAALKALNEEGLKDQKLSQEIAKVSADKTQARKAETKAIDQQKLAQQALREEQMRAVKESQLAQLEIKLRQEGDAELYALAKERYRLGLELARDDALQRAIVEKQYQLEREQILDQAQERDYRRLEERQREEQRAADERLRLQQEAIAKAEQALSSFEEFGKHLTLTTASEVQSAVSTLGSIIDQHGEAFAKAAAEAILFGDTAEKSFKEVSGELLKTLAIEASVRALMEGAKAIAFAFVNPALAGNALAAAGAYTAAAAAAKVGASALGVGAGGGATGGTTASPTGAPQVATAPQREQAESREMVFNLNFGGAVIYDTKEAAKRAMIGDIVRTYNGNNRGMPRFNFAR